MKKFKNLFEQSPAADYKVKKDEDAEVKDIKPRSSDEEKFKNMHKVEKKEHPVAPSEVHTGDRAKGKKSDAGQDHTGYEKAGEPVLKTYAQFAKMGGHGGDSYKGVGKSAGEKAPVMQGSSKIKEEVELDEFNKKDYAKNEDDNEHSLNALELVKKFGTPNEIKDMQGIYDRHMKRGHITEPDSSKRNAYNRKYYSKLKEEIEHIDEAFKSGELKLKSGETVKVDEATAKMLNNTFKQLSVSNKTRMQSEAMKSKKSFESIVKFAKTVG